MIIEKRLNTTRTGMANWQISLLKGPYGQCRGSAVISSPGALLRIMFTARCREECMCVQR